MCSCASLVDPLCWEQVWEWSPSASRTKRPQLQRRCGPFKAGIAMPRNWQNHDVHQSKGKVMTVSCCSDERQVMKAGGAHLKYLAFTALSSSLSGMSFPRMEVGAATLAGMSCSWCSSLTCLLRLHMLLAAACKCGAHLRMMCEVRRACVGQVLVLPSSSDEFCIVARRLRGGRKRVTTGTAAASGTGAAASPTTSGGATSTH